MATLVFVLVAVTVWNVFSRHVDAQLDAIRQQGYPVTLTELDNWYQAVPASQNNARIYEQVFASGFGNFEEIDWPARDRDLGIEDKKRLAEIVAANRDALGLLHSAQTTNSCRYSIDLKKGWAARLGPAFDLIRGVQVLCAEGVLHAADGDSPEAVRSFLDAGLLADSVTEDPVLIAQIVRPGCWSIIVRRMERAIDMTPMTEEQLTLLQSMLAEAERPEALLRGLAGERALGIAAFNNTASVLEERQLSGRVKERLAIGLAKSTGFFEKDRTFYLDVMEKSVAAASLPFPERLRLGGQIPSPTAGPRFNVLSRLVLPRISSMFTSEAEAVARLRTAQTALAVERFRRGHGGVVPSTLQELVPGYFKAVPADPFDGVQVRFRTFESGCLIYTSRMDTRNPGPLGFRIEWPRGSSRGAETQLGTKSGTGNEPEEPSP